MPDPDLIASDIGPDEFRSLFTVSRETVDRLRVYADRLRTWQRTINLVAPGTLASVWHRHFADSAQLLDLAPPRARTWVDLGSGAGFPGLVIAILLAERGPGRRVTLLESDSRKAAFLAEVVRATGIGAVLPVDILCARIEATATRDKVGTADVVTARALAPLDRLLALAAPLLGPASVGLFLKGRGVEAELAAAQRSWQVAYDLVSSRTDAQGRIVIVRSLASRDGG